MGKNKKSNVDEAILEFNNNPIENAGIEAELAEQSMTINCMTMASADERTENELNAEAFVEQGDKLRKIKKPISVGSCIVFVLLFIILTVMASFIVAVIQTGTSDYGSLAFDMCNKLGLITIYNNIVIWFGGVIDWIVALFT